MDNQNILESEIQQLKDELEPYRVERDHPTFHYKVNYLSQAAIFQFLRDKCVINENNDIDPNMVSYYARFHKVLQIVSDRIAEERKAKREGRETYDELVAKAIA